MEEIYLKCKHCKEAHSYKPGDNFIVAIDGEWKQIEGEYLSDKPLDYEEYEFKIHGPLKLGLRDNFWSVFMNPDVRSNGFENEQDIRSVCFCLVKPLELMAVDDDSARLKVRVVKTVEMNSLGITENPEISWMPLLEEHSESRKYYHVENHPVFSLIDINIESDLGLTLIVEKKDSKSRIVAVNEWDFHKDLWYYYCKDITKEEELKYGIQH